MSTSLYSSSVPDHFSPMTATEIYDKFTQPIMAMNTLVKDM